MATEGLYGGVDMARIMYGQHARHVPAWMYVQNQGQSQGDGTVAMVGASRVRGPHPLCYGSRRAHQFIVGEVIVRPHLVIATDALQGMGASALLTEYRPFAELLSAGEVLVGSDADFQSIRRQLED